MGFNILIKLGQSVCGCALPLIFVSLAAPACSVAQSCASSYADGDVDDALSTAHAWSEVSDIWNQYPCTPPNISTFTHTYQATATIWSPAGRSNSSNQTTYAYMGGGSARADAYLDLADGDFGTYYMDDSEELDCTVGGTLVMASASRPWLAFGRAMTTYQYNGTQTDTGLCNYNKTCSDTFNYCGAQLTSFSQVDGQCKAYQAAFFRFVKIGSYRTCRSIPDPITGLWNVWSDTYIGCDGPLP